MHLAAKNLEDAYAARSLFMRSADIRAWSWMGTDATSLHAESDLRDRKFAHFRLNRCDLKSAMNKCMDNTERNLWTRTSSKASDLGRRRLKGSSAANGFSLLFGRRSNALQLT